MRRAAERAWSNLGFAAFFALAFVLFLRIVWPLLMPVVLAGFAAVMVSPAHEALLEKFPKHRTVCALTATVGLLLLVGLPLLLVGWWVVQEVAVFLESAKQMLLAENGSTALTSRLPGWLIRQLDFERPGSEGTFAAAVSGGTNVIGKLLDVGTGFLVGLVMMTIALYYFLLDGRRLLGELGRTLPLQQRYFDAFLKEFQSVTHAVVYGNALTATIQGFIGFIGLTLAGVPHAAVWSLVMGLVALVPIGGAALVWLPVGLATMAAGRMAAGGFVLFWGMLAVSSLDNFLRPRLCSARMALHPLLVIVSTFGGLAVLGASGLVVGPLVTALLMSMVRIYRRDFLSATQGASESAPSL